MMEATLTQDEKMLLTHLPSAIGGAMAVAGRSGLFGTGKEMFATSQALLAGAKDYPDNALIRDIVPDVAGDRSAEMEDMRATRDWSMARMKGRQVDSAEKMIAAVVEDCREAAGVLARIDPQQAYEYKAWAMQIADKVAQASTEGGFLGIGGTRLSDAETKLLEEIRGALGA